MKHPIAAVLSMFFLYEGALFAQTYSKHTITFHPTFGNSKMKPGEVFYKINENDSIQIETLKFYISRVQLLKNNIVVWKEENSFHLLDGSDDKSLNINVAIPPTITFNQITFYVGIDSITNSSGAIGSDLDPTHGMYWTWQSGYINFKFEGKSNRCKTRNNEFQFHIGGYLSPFYALQTAMLNAGEHQQTNIDIDCKKLIEGIDLAKQNHIMSPGREAVLFSEKIVKIFVVH